MVPNDPRSRSFHNVGTEYQPPEEESASVEARSLGMFDPRVAAALAHLEREAPSATEPLRVAARLRRELEPELARAAADLYELRRRANGRFPAAGQCFFTRKGLEQATREPIARARAERIRGVDPNALVLDSTCGIGGDSVALASRMRTVAIDLDLLTAQCAKRNLAVIGVRDWVLVADALAPPIRADFVVLDADRRAGGERSLDPERWSPPLSAAIRLARAHRGACLKLSPAFDVERLPIAALASLDHRWQWVSCDGELRELALWTGELARTDGRPGLREALAIDRGERAELSGFPEAAPLLDSAENADGATSAINIAARVRWLCEPDAAVIRSGLLGNLCRAEGLTALDPKLAYLASEHATHSGLVRSWRVIASAPLDPRHVRRMLAEHDVGDIQVMKRGHPDPAEALARRFRGDGAQRGLLAVARLERGHVAFLLESGGENAAPSH